MRRSWSSRTYEISICAGVDGPKECVGSTSPKMYEGGQNIKKRAFAWIYLAGFGVLVPMDQVDGGGSGVSS